MSVAYQRDTVDIDLDSLTTEQLLEERGLVKGEIHEIATQLMDKDRRPPEPEDDSPAWCAFRDWRRRARWALTHRRKELEEIKQLLRERQDVALASRLLRVASGAPTTEDLLGHERALRLRKALESHSADMLLLWAYRLLRRLLDGRYVNSFPDELNEADRDALRMIGMHLRQAYGVGSVKRFTLDDTATPSTPEAATPCAGSAGEA